MRAGGVPLSRIRLVCMQCKSERDILLDRQPRKDAIFLKNNPALRSRSTHRLAIK